MKTKKPVKAKVVKSTRHKVRDLIRKHKVKGELEINMGNSWFETALQELDKKKS